MTLRIPTLTATLATIIFPSAHAEEAPPRFNRDVRPILSENCFACHGPDEKKREAKLRLDLPEEATRARKGVTPVVPGKPEASEVMARVVSTDPDERMPPPDAHLALSEKEIDTLRRWIAAGAEYEQHWAFIAPERAPLPEISRPEWAQNAIDTFILARLDREKLSPAPDADRRVLIRRLFLDLTGLPPTPEDVHAFLADSSADAYEKLVDRLLASPHFGERMAVDWLDAARYADTNGYSIDGGRHMWLWRDWVIDAFNADKPFDQFTVEQLAGDLLPERTEAQLVASGFNRNHMITHEGGTIPEENLVNYVSDRVRTTAEVFLGLTMQCSQCHDHKFDPLTQRDYYRFYAYFNAVDERGLDGDGGNNASPSVSAHSVLREADTSDLEKRIGALEEKLKQPWPGQASWEEKARAGLAARGRDLALHPLEILRASTPNNTEAIQPQEDGSVLVLAGGGVFGASVSMRLDPALVGKPITGLRVVAMPDERLPNKSSGNFPGDGLKGGFVLSEFTASCGDVPSDQVDLYREIPITTATASYAHPDFPPEGSLDPRYESGWSVYPEGTKRQHITYTFAQPIDAARSPYVTVMLTCANRSGANIGRFQVFAMTGNDDGSAIPVPVQEALALAPEKRAPQQAEAVRAYHVSVAPETAWLRNQLANLRDELAESRNTFPTMVMNQSGKPRETHILDRGAYDAPKERVEPGVPAALPPLPEGATGDRLALARWLVDPNHPLTARVTVNRFWQTLFGTGIVSTVSDFGSQGEWPSHPELLDWLAREFIESGWDVKHVLKLMVTSATYRQSSIATPEQLERDPMNRLLARGPRFRLQAEFIRDTALSLGGILSPRVGGPSVRPYQPPNLWKEVSHFGSTPATEQAYYQEHGEKIFRRGLYVFVKRTVPPPSLGAFDAPNRETCVTSRFRTNTPLQALVLLNDPQYVEACRTFAERVLKRETDDAKRIRYAFECATSRVPTDAETTLITRTLNRERAAYKADPAAANALLGIGEFPRDLTLDPAEHAAWTLTANLLLNLSETITKE